MSQSQAPMINVLACHVSGADGWTHEARCPLREEETRESEMYKDCVVMAPFHFVTKAAGDTIKVLSAPEPS